MDDEQIEQIKKILSNSNLSPEDQAKILQIISGNGLQVPPVYSDEQLAKEEIRQIRAELKSAFQKILQELPKKLKPEQIEEFKREFNQIDELLERLESSLVWVAFFGKAAVGKSSIINSLLGSDLAKIGVEMGTTTEPGYFTRSPWQLVDVPGILDGKILEDIAVKEAKKAHGHIFVIDGEPTQPELDLFNVVCNATPNHPKVLFVNKWDRMAMPEKDKEILKKRIIEKMNPFVTSPQYIIFGSAAIYDRESDSMVRQEIPQLVEALYSSAGTFGDVVNIIDPAQKAGLTLDRIRNSIVETRKKVARQVINWFAIACTASGFIPFDSLIAIPGILASMVYTVFLIMGKKQDKGITLEVTVNLLKACGQTLGVIFAASVLADIITASLLPVLPVASLVLYAIDLTGLPYFKYRRAVVLGEVTIEYVLNDCSWGGESQEAVIKRCAKRAEEHYFQLKKQNAKAIKAIIR